MAPAPTLDDEVAFLSGVDVAQQAGTIITISAAQLPHTTFVTGSSGDALQIRAFDGISWSASDNAAWSPFQLAVR